MDLNDTPELAEYRTKVRAWLAEHKPEAPERDDVPARREWQRKLAEAGLAAVTWPADYGGQGLGPLHQVVVNQEIGRAGVPGIFDVIGVGMLGPTLIAHGDEEQKQRHLGPILAADEVWCQLFSEPAAGSEKSWHHTSSAVSIGPRWRCFWSSSPWAMIVGPSMPTPITSNSPGTPAREISWLRTTWCSGPRPWPPYSAGHVTAASPASASLRCHSRWAPTDSASSRPLRCGASAACSSSQARTLARYSASSGVSLRSIPQRYRPPGAWAPGGRASYRPAL